MLQARNAIKLFEPSMNRSLDITELKGHLIRVFNFSLQLIGDLLPGQTKPDDPEAIFLFG